MRRCRIGSICTDWIVTVSPFDLARYLWLIVTAADSEHEARRQRAAAAEKRLNQALQAVERAREQLSTYERRKGLRP